MLFLQREKEAIRQECAVVSKLAANLKQRYDINVITIFIEWFFMQLTRWWGKKTLITALMMLNLKLICFNSELTMRKVRSKQPNISLFIAFHSIIWIFCEYIDLSTGFSNEQQSRHGGMKVRNTILRKLWLLYKRISKYSSYTIFVS